MDSPFVVADKRFREMVLPNCWLERLYQGSLWAEGPVWFADGAFLLWSDIPNDRMLQWIEGLGVRVYRQPANNSNGNTRDREGRLVSCEHGARRVSRTERDGAITVLADAYRGKRLNSPNDVVVRSDGLVYFTDPPYGILSDYEGHKAESELGANYVFRLDPARGQLDIAVDDFARPNGLAFSPDERLLYIGDSAGAHEPTDPHHIRRFKVDQQGKLTGGEVFVTITPGVPDGMRCDTDGNLWTSAGDGVHCYAPDATLLGKVLVPEPVSNLTFGGAKRNRLLITATTSLYGVYVAQSGAQRP